MTPPKLHKAGEAGAIVGKSASWMYKKGAAGLIPRTKIGHDVRWTDEQLTQIIRDCAEEPTPRKKQKAEQRQAAAESKAVERSEKKRKPAPLANVKNIPTADFSVSRLYRNQEAS